MAPRLEKSPAPVLERSTVTEAGEMDPPSSPLKLAEELESVRVGAATTKVTTTD
jgi:hypothetical protein